MARAHTVWLVTHRILKDPVGAFTVKHELVSYLQRQGAVADYEIWALPDGHPGNYSFFPSAEGFLKANR